jgi:hypothetical protein
MRQTLLLELRHPLRLAAGGPKKHYRCYLGAYEGPKAYSALSSTLSHAGYAGGHGAPWKVAEEDEGGVGRPGPHASP